MLEVAWPRVVYARREDDGDPDAIAMCNAAFRITRSYKGVTIASLILLGRKETVAAVRQALETLVRDESGKRLIALGATMPDAKAAPRRSEQPSDTCRHAFASVRVNRRSINLVDQT